MENNVSERITDIGSAGGGSLEGPNKGKCTDQEMLLHVDIVNGPNPQEGEKKLKGSGSGKASVRKMWPGRDKQSGGHKELCRDNAPEKEKGPNRENIHEGSHCRNKCTDISKTSDRDKKPYRDRDPAMDKEPDRGDGIGRDKKPLDRDKENIPDGDKGHNNGWIRMINILVWVIVSYCDVLSGDTSKW